jgi:hypothetical protein
MSVVHCAARHLRFVLARRRLFVFLVAKKRCLDWPEGGAAAARFLVLQHERGRRAVLGPSAIDAQSAF